jgi:hypothetical protein
MYIKECPGGFPIPAASGKIAIMGIIAAVKTTTSASEVAIVDDDAITSSDQTGRILSTLTNQTRVLKHLKGVASVDGTLGVLFPEPIKTRYGVSVYVDNTVAGSVCLYIK